MGNNISNLPDQKTPARPVEINFAAETGTPSGNQNLALIGHAPTGINAGNLYTVYDVSNVADPVAVVTELNTQLGGDCELLRMVVAAIKANQDNSQFVTIAIIPLASTDTNFGPANEALTALDKIEAEYVVSPYDGQSAPNRNLLKTQIANMSAPARVDNNQFGSFGVIANRNVTVPTALTKFDSQFLIGIYLRDTGTGPNAPVYSLGEVAAAAAARMAGNPVPFNPEDDISIPGLNPPEVTSDNLSIGFGLDSEAALNQGWTPLKVKADGTVAFVRSVTGRISPDGSGSPVVTSYYDVQDFQVLYFWRKTLFTRFSQPDMKQRKASQATAQDIKAEVIRLAKLFENQQMFQAVDQLAKQIQVVRSTTDRSRFNVLTPVNVIPGLHVIATNVLATTQFDSLFV